MSSRSERLQPAVEQARQKSEDALTELAAQQQRVVRAENQLQELERYRTEYAELGSTVLNVATLLNRQRFIARIDRAIVQQTTEIDRQHRQLDQVRSHWQFVHARESARSSVVKGHQERERRAEERLEQSEIDERMQHRRPR